MQDVFDFRNRLIDEYAAFSRSASRIAADALAARVDEEYARGRYWPAPLIQVNPNYKRDGTVQKLVKDGSLCTCSSGQRLDGGAADPASVGPHRRPGR